MTNRIDTTRPLFMALGCVTREPEGSGAIIAQCVEITTSGYALQSVGYLPDCDGVARA